MYDRTNGPSDEFPTGRGAIQLHIRRVHVGRSRSEPGSRPGIFPRISGEFRSCQGVCTDFFGGYGVVRNFFCGATVSKSHWTPSHPQLGLWLVSVVFLYCVGWGVKLCSLTHFAVHPPQFAVSKSLFILASCFLLWDIYYTCLYFTGCTGFVHHSEYI